MNGVVGTRESRHETVLTGDHHIVETVKLQDNITGLKAGDLLTYTRTGYKKGAAGDAAYVAVLLEDFDGTTKDTALNVCIHGTVRAEKLLLAGEAAPEAVRAKLRARGIYAVGAFTESE